MGQIYNGTLIIQTKNYDSPTGDYTLLPLGNQAESGDVKEDKQGYDSVGNIIIGAYEGGYAGLISSYEEMDSYLTEENVGRILKYIGEEEKGNLVPVNPYIVNQDASNQYINAAIDPMDNISQFVFDGQIGHMLGFNEDGIILDTIKMVKIADGHYQLQYTVDGETFQTMWDNTLSDPWMGLKQIGTLERDKVYYWKSDMGNASMVENQNAWGAYISKDGQWNLESKYKTNQTYIIENQNGEIKALPINE